MNATAIVANHARPATLNVLPLARAGGKVLLAAARCVWNGLCDCSKARVLDEHGAVARRRMRL